MSERTPTKDIDESEPEFEIPTDFEYETNRNHKKKNERVSIPSPAPLAEAAKNNVELGPLDEIRENLLLFVKKHLDAYDTYDVKLNSKLVQGLEVRQCIDSTVDDSIVSITKCKVPGLTIEKYKQFKEEVVKHTPYMDKKLVMTKLDDVDGHIVTHTLVKMPMMMTNRSVFNLYF